MRLVSWIARSLDSILDLITSTVMALSSFKWDYNSCNWLVIYIYQLNEVIGQLYLFKGYDCSVPALP